MKTAKIIVKILAAVAAVAGAAYLIAVYGDRIVAWAKKLIKPCCNSCQEPQTPDEEIPVTIEEAPAEPQEATEAEPSEEPEVTPAAPSEADVEATEGDFEG